MKQMINILIGWLVFLGLALMIWQLLPWAEPYWRRAQLWQQAAPTTASLPNPLPGQRFQNTWAAARSGGRKHEGVDIFAPRGTPIYATTHGLVDRVGTDQLGGNVVGIIGPGWTWHYYAHLERDAGWKVGDWIEAGAVVGYVGDSGNAKGTPPHLHYGVYTQKGAVNPYPLIRQP